MNHDKLYKTLQSLLDVHNKVISKIKDRFINDLERNIEISVDNNCHILIVGNIYMVSPFHKVQRRLTQKLKTYKF